MICDEVFVTATEEQCDSSIFWQMRPEKLTTTTVYIFLARKVQKVSTRLSPLSMNLVFIHYSNDSELIRITLFHFYFLKYSPGLSGPQISGWLLVLLLKAWFKRLESYHTVLYQLLY